jgi:hypothetical protein
MNFTDAVFIVGQVLQEVNYGNPKNPTLFLDVAD